MKANNKWTRRIALFLSLSMLPVLGNAATCSNKLFSTTIDSSLSIGDAIENLADTCGLTVSVNDEWAKKRLDKKLYFVKLNNTTLKGFLDTILTDNDLNYKLSGDKLTISYLTTHTFRVHYISGKRIGESRANVIISQSSSTTDIGGTSSGGSTTNGDSDTKTSTSITNNDEFKFWETVENEVQRVLTTAADNAIHYTRAGDSWIGSDGKKWEYNPLAPIINPAAGMVTVTGTKEQVARVARYIDTLQNQIRTQVLIDVQIMSVSFDDSTTTGVDWNELYKLENMTINTYAMGQKNMLSWTSDPLTGITGDKTFAEGTKPTNAGVFELSGSTQVQDVVRFLATQGDVKTVSSPRVMTLNNQPALISAGKDIYYKLKTSTTVGDNAGAATEGEQLGSVFEGVLLDITPEVDKNGMVTLKINPSITIAEEATTATINRDMPPNMYKRQMSAVIKVKDGSHAIMGGLIISRSGTDITKVPLLGDLPLFEYAFKKEQKIDKIEELVLIVTPHVVRNSKDVSLRDLGYERVNAK